jgi:signal peptidase I
MADKKISQWLWWFWREWGRPLLYAIAVIAPLRASIADWYDVPTGSMKPTIIEGDRVFVNKLAYDLKIPFTNWRIAHWSDPARGDIVVFPSPADGIRLVKRVIGLPGDVISMQNNQLSVNGSPVKYESLQSDIVRKFPIDQKDRFQFLKEELPTKNHSLMLIPSRPAMRSFPPIKVPAGQYFMMGDNRDDSGDSRYFGFVDREKIAGKATAVALSLDRDHYFLPRWSRFLNSLN